MTLIKRPNSRFWYVQFQIDNQTFVRSTKTADRKVASKIADKIRSDVQQSMLLGQTKTITFGEAMRRYVDSKSGTPSHSNLLSIEKTALRLIRRQRLSRL
ncbi:hypothetical protein [Nitratireductor aquibiodomus]|uniref:hypothetical protein n=1 Tax=Nitratireductor aquibiodomus TaxID=204799 RepID=UPI0002D7F4C2|nr:hypothetical protein [Nitratireductor aquibiodomus]